MFLVLLIISSASFLHAILTLFIVLAGSRASFAKIEFNEWQILETFCTDSFHILNLYKNPNESQIKYEVLLKERGLTRYILPRLAGTRKSEKFNLSKGKLYR